MQVFIAYGRVANVPEVGSTSTGVKSFKFDFACDSSQVDENKKPLPVFLHVQVYGKQAEVMEKSLMKGTPILLKGELIQRSYTDREGQRRYYQYIAPAPFDGITFLESKAAAAARRQGQKSPLQSVESLYSDYPVPLDADEPF